VKTEKIEAVEFNNRARQLSVQYRSGKAVHIHFGQIGIAKTVSRMWVDHETNGRAIGIEFADGSIDFIPYDQPLAVAKDPEYLLQHQMEVLTALIRRKLEQKKVSLRFLARELGTSDNQIQRLLNPNILNKNLTQLSKIAVLLGLEVEVRLKGAA